MSSQLEAGPLGLFQGFYPADKVLFRDDSGEGVVVEPDVTVLQIGGNLFGCEQMGYLQVGGTQLRFERESLGVGGGVRVRITKVPL